jgi:beta-N-acetylhexosaminidase
MPSIPRALLEDFGQLFLLAFDGPRLPAEVAEFLRTFSIGGVVLFGDNYRDPGQLRALISDLQSHGAAPDRPLFVATDHEGGRVQRFREGFTRLPAMATCGDRDPRDTESLHRQAARELREAGINFNFAPVADLCPADRPGAVGDRSFGDDPQQTARHVAAAVRGLQDEGLLACAKHFPGHGPTSEDSHRVLPVVSRTFPELAAQDLVPFRAAIDAGVAAVMTAHVLYPEAGDDRLPASLSPFWLRQVLREDLRFEGLIVTDALEMKALRGRFSPAECGRRALEAGSDLLLYYKEAHQYSAFWELRSAFERGELDPGPIAASLERVRAAKRRLAGVTPA